MQLHFIQSHLSPVEPLVYGRRLFCVFIIPFLIPSLCCMLISIGVLALISVEL